MSKIHVLDPLIANKIAAGEVVEKPASVIKELVENAIDAGSTSITVEIKGGGKDYIRVSDNGHGIESDDMLTAFQRHATSKISEIDDIYNIQSLGFRGEALASIASVSHIELISKIKDNEFGNKLVLAGGKILSQESVGASNGTTIVMKELFFNTPARLKFLKSDGAEQNAISTIVNKLALSHTNISFKYIINDRITFKTPGNGDLKDAVYEIYGKSVSSEMISFEHDEENSIKAKGLLSTIQYTRGNRQLQVIFVNGRYIVNKIVSEALELAYKGLVPLHRHPVCFLFLELDPQTIDVNIHPSKTEIKFHEEAQIKQLLYSALRKCINSYNQVPQESFKKVDVFSKPMETVENKKNVTEGHTPAKEMSRVTSPINDLKQTTQENISKDRNTEKMLEAKIDIKEDILSSQSNTVRESINTNRPTTPQKAVDVLYQSVHEKDKKLEVVENIASNLVDKNDAESNKNTISDKSFETSLKSPALDLSEDVLQRPEVQKVDYSIKTSYNSGSKSSSSQSKRADTPKGNQYDFKELLVRETPDKTSKELDYLPDGQSVYDELLYIGQAFESYLLFQKNTQLYFIDQHAAHEKILYETFREKYKNRKMEAQMLLDPITISMTYNEQELLLSNLDAFTRLGFDIEAFGMNDIIIRSVPILFDRPAGKSFVESLIEKIEGQNDLSTLQDDEIIMQSCKAAIKANHRVDHLEVKQMLKDLRNLEDPYTCPHGRPIIIAIHEYEIERKFKRT